MHVLLSVILVSAAVWKGDWRQWQSYIHTIFYVITCNLLYNLLCKDYMLWEYQMDFIGGTHTIVELLYTFITLPAITLLFLSHYPYLKSKGRQFIFLLLWVAGSVLIEYPLYQLNRIHLHNGYEFWMELLFYPTMYGMIRLHVTRPFLTYGLSAAITIFMLRYFHVPIK